MFLSHSDDFMSILGIDKASNQVCSRNIAHWFQDIQTLLDHEDSENGQLNLICLSELIYEKGYILDALDLDDIRREASALEAQARRKVEETFFPPPEHKLLIEMGQREYTKIVTYIEPLAKEAVLRHRGTEVERTYNSILGKLWQIADICDTLSMAKAQMRAFEIQQKKNATSVPLDYQIEDIPETTLNALCDLKYNQKYFLNGWNKEKFLSECKNLWESCKKQPISLVLLPLLLTILMVEEVAHKNLYAYLKQTKRYLSIDSKAKIAQLYDDVCEVLRLGYKDCMNWWIPIFNWREIEKRFYEYNKLSTDDQREAHYYLCKLRYKNGLSKQEERELARKSYGTKLQALAKICNLNCFMMLALQTPEGMESPNPISQMEPPNPNGQGVTIPAKAKSAYKLLMSDQVLPREKGATKTFDSYFKDLYTQSFGNPFFSYVALLRYYQLPLDQVYDNIPRGLTQLATLFDHKTSSYVRRLKENFSIYLDCTPYYKDLESKELNQSSGITNNLPSMGNSEIKANYIRRGYKLSYQIADKYSEEDYRDFIGNINHFENAGFRDYLARFCKEQHIDLYPTELNQENLMLERVAYSTIMEFVQYYLEKNFFNYWKDHIVKEFGLYNDAVPQFESP